VRNLVSARELSSLKALTDQVVGVIDCEHGDIDDKEMYLQFSAARWCRPRFLLIMITASRCPHVRAPGLVAAIAPPMLVW